MDAIQASDGSCTMGSVKHTIVTRSQSNEMPTQHTRKSSIDSETRSRKTVSADVNLIINEGNREIDVHNEVKPDDVPRSRTSEEMNDQNSTGNPNLKYNLNCTGNSLDLSIGDPAIELHITHGQYEITVKQKDSC